MKFSKIMKKIRKEKGWTQTDLQNKTGISRVTLGNYETEKQSPMLYNAIKIAKTLGFSLDSVS